MQLIICKMIDKKILTCGTKTFAPVTYQASKWVREEIIGKKTSNCPQTKNGLTIQDNLTTMRGRLINNALGYFHNHNNTVWTNQTSVGIYSTGFAAGDGISIIPENLMKVCGLFAARKTIKSTWTNQKDEYSAPNTDHPDYPQWNNDACLYALFHSSSRQSSLHNVPYNEKIYQIKNEFFFMSKDEMKEIADKIAYAELYHDAQHEPNERYVYTLLKDMQLSEDAKHILESARTLVRETMPMREGYSREHPELQLNSWDAGYVQLKGLWKEHAKEKFDQFRTDYLKFDKRMMKGVYKFGFLEPDFSTENYKEE